MILGLDISTSITGMTILDEQGEIIYNDAIDTKKYKSIFEKAHAVRQRLQELSDQFKIDSIFIEKVPPIFPFRLLFSQNSFCLIRF